MTYITGFHGMEELVRKGSSGSVLLVASAGPRIKKILDLAKKSGCHIKNISKNDLDKLAPDNRGAALELQEDVSLTEEINFDEWLAGSSYPNNQLPEKMFVLLLDHIEDPHNLGAIIRSSDIFAADLIIMPDKRAAKETDVVSRSSAGAVAYVPLCTVTNLASAIDKLKKAGFWCYTADMNGQDISKTKFSGRVALIMGGEGNGVSRLLSDKADLSISIPQAGHIDSLNVSVAAGILLYEIRKQLNLE